MTHTLGDGPVDPAYAQKMTAIMSAVDGFMNEGAKGADREVGIVILMFPFGDTEGGRCNFMSNGANRDDIVSLFKEMIARFEGQPELKGSA